MVAQCDIGLIGLAVMGQKPVLTMADHGFHAAVYNRTTRRVDDFMAGAGRDKTIVHFSQSKNKYRHDFL